MLLYSLISTSKSFERSVRYEFDYKPSKDALIRSTFYIYNIRACVSKIGNTALEGGFQPCPYNLIASAGSELFNVNSCSMITGEGEGAYFE